MVRRETWNSETQLGSTIDIINIHSVYHFVFIHFLLFLPAWLTKIRLNTVFSHVLEPCLNVGKASSSRPQILDLERPESTLLKKYEWKRSENMAENKRLL